MRRITRIRTAGWLTAGLLTAVAAAAALADNRRIFGAAIALAVGLGVAVVIDAWHETHEAKSERSRALERINLNKAEAHTELRNAVRKITESQRHEARQLEALLQVLPRVGNAKVLPPSGGYAMDGRAIAELADVIATRSPRLVVELGSGTSTVWTAYLVARTGGRIVSVDHLEHYAEATRADLHRHGLDAVAEVRLAPLVEAEDGSRWYDTAALEDLSGIDLVIVDGPPAATGPHARYPALRAVREKLAPGALIVLDDIVRVDEREVLADWVAEWPGLSRVDSGTSTLAVLQVPTD